MSGRSTVGIAAQLVVHSANGEIATHSLGSCVGVTVYDPVARIGGMVHFMLPMPGSTGPSDTNPDMYCSSALPRLFRQAYAMGGHKDRLIVCAAGGAETLDGDGSVPIGQRNRTMLRKILWKNSVTLHAEDTGGRQARSMILDLEDGTVRVFKSGVESVLWRAA